MSESENPYRAPQTSGALSADRMYGHRAEAEAIHRGRWIFLGIAAVLACGVLLPSVLATSVVSVRAGILIGLLYAAWRGHGWAILLIVYGFAIGALSLMAEALWALSGRSTVTGAACLVNAAVYAAFVWCFFTSENLNAFFKEQERKRTEIAQDEDETPWEGARPEVSISQRAAEFARREIAERGFKADTALKLIHDPSATPQYRIEYDVPEPDRDQWQIISHGITILVDKEAADRLPTLVIDCEEDSFTFRTGAVAAAAGEAESREQQTARVVAGAYYFDGWSGKTGHITELLKTDFADREPVWGWKDDTPTIMQKQIDYAADYGLAFWAFCWYYPEEPDKQTPLNNALGLYLKAPNRDRLRFCLLVANHGGFRIGPKDWDACCRRWIEVFRVPTHQKVDGKPLLIIFSPGELRQAFGSTRAVHDAFDSLRAKAKAAGLPGVTVAACTGPGSHLKELADSGYSVLTGYNYNLGWLNGGGEKPFKTLIEGGRRIWDQFAKDTPLPYVPVVTAGWDRRPWEMGKYPPERMSTYYPDRTPEQVEEFVRDGVRWLDRHPDKTLPQRVLLIYAWNENGEGGYLTPTKKDGTAYLEAVARGLKR